MVLQFYWRSQTFHTQKRWHSERQHIIKNTKALEGLRWSGNGVGLENWWKAGRTEGGPERE